MASMNHPLYDVTDFELLDTHTLRITFDDGHQQTVDFGPILHGDVFGPLRDPAVFRQVRLDAELRNLVWPNGAMLDPWTLHDWPRVAAQMAERAQSWADVRQMA